MTPCTGLSLRDRLAEARALGLLRCAPVPHRIAAAEALPSIRPAAERALSLALAPDEPVLWRAEPRRLAMLGDMGPLLPFVLWGCAFASLGHWMAIACAGVAVLAAFVAAPTIFATTHTTYAITERRVVGVGLRGWREVPPVKSVDLDQLVRVECHRRPFGLADLSLHITLTRDRDGALAAELVMRGLHRRDVARIIEHLPQGHRPEVPR